LYQSDTIHMLSHHSCR